MQYVVGGIDANGKEIWSQDFPADSSSIAADTAGDLYLLSEPHDATAVDLSAYSSSGAVRWTRSFSGGYPKMSVEQDGDVVLVGDILDNNCNAVRLDKNGNELWRTAFSVGEFGTGSDVFLAGDGSKRLDIGYNDYQDQFYPIIQIDSDGHILWQNQVSDRMDGISACQDGGVIACRSERIDDSTMRFHTIKFSSQGDEVFDSNFDTQADANDPWGGAFFGYAADRFGNTYVRAVTCVSAGFDQCFQYQSTVVKYDEYGNEVWTVEVRSIPEGPSGDSREFSNTLGTLATNNSAPSSILSSEAVYFVSPMGAFALSPDLRPTFDYDDDSAGDDDTTVDDDSDDDSSHSSGGDNSGCGC